MRSKKQKMHIVSALSQVIDNVSNKLKNDTRTLISRPENNVVRVGEYTIVKAHNLYCVHKNNNVLFADVSLFDVALLLVDYHINNVNYMQIQRLLQHENEFFKWHSDAVNFRRIINSTCDKDVSVYENRYHQAKENARMARHKIDLLKRRCSFWENDKYNE